MALLCTHSNVHVILELGPTPGCRSPGGVSPDGNRERESCPLICWWHSFWCIPGYSWLSWLKAQKHFQLTSNFLPTSVPKSFSPGLLWINLWSTYLQYDGKKCWGRQYLGPYRSPNLYISRIYRTSMVLPLSLHHRRTIDNQASLVIDSRYNI